VCDVTGGRKESNVSGEGSMQRIATLCPDLKRIRILTEDRHLEIFAREASGLKIEELDAHIAWSRESGINPIKINSLFYFQIYSNVRIDSSTVSRF